MGEVVADEALLNPGLVINEGAGATWGGSGGEISTLTVAAEVAADGGGSNVERVCGFLEGVTLVDHGVDDAFSQVGRVRHASA